MLKKPLVILFVSILFTILFTYLYVEFFTNRHKIGFVKSGNLLNEYKGMQDASKNFDAEFKIAKANDDTLRNRYENLKLKQKYLGSKVSFELDIAEKEWYKYHENFVNQIEQRKNQLTKDILNEINEYIQEYAKKNNYEYILGTTNDGSILYGIEKNDLTAKLIADLNEKYKSKLASTNSKK